MAEASFSEDAVCCPICLDLLKDPVTINCGHSYCMSCITGCWDQDDEKTVYSCPQCRQTFTPRPALGRNTILAEIVETLKKTKLQSDVQSDVQCYAGAGDVECNICTGRKHKAVKSCLVCLNSYCQNHVEQHESFFKDNTHSLIDATGRLKDLICSEHHRPLEVFCRTDQQCICFMCMMDKHKNHDTEKASADRSEKQIQLEEKQRQVKVKIQQRQKKIQELRDAVESHKRSAQAAVEDSEKIFTELSRSIERRRSEVTQLIRDQESTAVRRAEGLLERLEQEIEDLRRRDVDLEQLLNTDDHIQFLQSFPSVSVPPESTDLLNLTVSLHLSFDDVKKKISLLRGKLEDFCKEETENISVNCLKMITTPDPKTREEFLQYSCKLSLDPNTANRRLSLSERNSAVTNTGKELLYLAHRDRFSCYAQVLCREIVCGRCYWEVEWRGRDDSRVGISVAYKSISRKGKGNECRFGKNNQSWRLMCYSADVFKFWHNNIKMKFPLVSSKIGVYVDHRAGTLSFYSVSDTMTLIHRVQTTFTQPLCPGFQVSHEAKVKLCDLTV